MENLGLPMSFGKQLPTKPEAAPSGSAEASSSRGGASVRGSRGVVEGSKKHRGRGRGGGGNVPKHVSGSNAEAMGEGSAKRSLDAMQSDETQHADLPPRPLGSGGLPDRPPAQNYQPHSMDHQGGRGGRGGHRGGGGGGGGRGGGHQPPERGFYQPSFAEDPWKELMEARERRWRQEAKG